MSTSTSVHAVPSTSTGIVEKFWLLRDELNAEVLEAEERIWGALCALVAGMHMAMIGAPGTAKTYLFDRLTARITGARIFSELMRKTMPPEAVYGQPSIKGMKNDEWRYVTDGMLPEADLALIDEFVRTSDAINNGMLTILNERRFKNGATIQTCPLHTAFLCANSLPVGDVEHDLEAFWDRVVLRFIVELPKDRATWRAIARLRPTPAPTPILTFEEVLIASQEAVALPVTDSAYDAIDEIRERLDRIGIGMSPRRVRQAQFLAAANAWLQGAVEVRGEHCDILMHMLWEVPEQQRDVEKIVVDVCSPGQKRAVELADQTDELAELIAEALALPPNERTGHLNELFDKSAANRAELDEALEGATGRALRTLESASKAQDSAHYRLMAEGFGVKGKQLAALRP